MSDIRSQAFALIRFFGGRSNAMTSIRMSLPLLDGPAQDFYGKVWNEIFFETHTEETKEQVGGLQC